MCSLLYLCVRSVAGVCQRCAELWLGGPQTIGPAPPQGRGSHYKAMLSPHAVGVLLLFLLQVMAVQAMCSPQREQQQH